MPAANRISDNGTAPVRVTLTLLFLLALAATGCRTVPTWVFQPPPGRGETFPDLTFAAPETAADRAYLGLDPDAATFRLSQVDADILIIEIVDMYCRACQEATREAKIAYNAIPEEPSGKSRVRMIGIGLGNSAFETAFFRGKYEVPFPIVPDPDGVLRTTLGNVPTPTFYGLLIRSQQLRIITYTGEHLLDDPPRFVKLTLRNAGRAE